jgi:hypothetical protein
MKRNLFKFGVMALGLSLIACDEDLGSSGQGSAEQALAESFLQAQSIFINSYNTVDLALRDSTFLASDSTMINGAVIMRNVDSIIVDYGNGAISPNDGKTRKGAIRGFLTGDYIMAGALLSADFVGYEVDDVSIDGNMTIQNGGNDSIILNSTSFIVDNEFTVVANQGLRWVSGFNTINDIEDDQYELAGLITGTELTNNSISVDITTPLYYDRMCDYGMVSGITDLTLTGDSTISFNSGVIDFLSSDGCNNNVSLTITTGSATLSFVKQFDGF